MSVILNEVWAVETGGAILHAFAEDLDWEYIYDAARWTYDESRHVLMGYERLRAWGFALDEMPLGSYIYDSAAGQEPIIRSGYAALLRDQEHRQQGQAGGSILGSIRTG